jgi:excisionase family DNA binding protein
VRPKLGPYRVSQVAEMLGMHPDTIRAYCDAGLIATFRTPGKHRRIHASAVDAFVAYLTQSATRSAA